MTAASIPSATGAIRRPWNVAAFTREGASSTGIPRARIYKLLERMRALAGRAIRRLPEEQ